MLQLDWINASRSISRKDRRAPFHENSVGTDVLHRNTEFYETISSNLSLEFRQLLEALISSTASGLYIHYVVKMNG